MIVSIKKSGVFKTSYDCAKADSEAENAICQVKELADLDVQLGSIYKSVVATLSVADRDALMTEHGGSQSAIKNVPSIKVGSSVCRIVMKKGLQN